MKRNPRCRELLEEAVAFHLLPDRRHEMRNHRTRPRKASGKEEEEGVSFELELVLIAYRLPHFRSLFF